MGCRYENEKLFFDEESGVDDGEYILVSIKNDLRLYNEIQFNNLLESLKGGHSLYIRRICATACPVEIKNGIMVVSNYFQECVSNKELRVSITSECICIDNGIQNF